MSSVLQSSDTPESPPKSKSRPTNPMLKTSKKSNKSGSPITESRTAFRKESFGMYHINASKTENDSLLSDLFKVSTGVSVFEEPGSEDNSSNNEEYSNRQRSETPQYLSSRTQLSSKTATPTPQRRNTSMKVSRERRVKKKRRIFSCDNCRKLKTKCSFKPEARSCDRCHRLRLDCSLANSTAALTVSIENLSSATDNTTTNGTRSTTQQSLDSSITASTSNSNSLHTGSNEQLENRLQSIEGSISLFDSKLNLILDAMKPKQSSSSTTSHQAQIMPMDEGRSLSTSTTPPINQSHIFPRHDSLAPLNVISQIDSKIFNRVSQMEPFRKACDEFISFYSNHEQLCLELAKSFLEVSHFWIIPGGITEINRQYVIDHPFTACVFVLLAMCFDKNYTYVEEQNTLYNLTNKILGKALIMEPLTDHDIEGILYLSLYNFARKPRQPMIDSWLLSSVGIKHSIMSIDLKNIFKRVKENDEFSADDLFHLRIFNSMCACHLQQSIGYGRPIMMNEEYWSLHYLTVKFPQATVGDAIKAAEIELYLVLSRDLTHQGIQKLECNFENDLLGSRNVYQWRVKWNKILKKDVSQILTFAYHFSHIMLSRKYIQLNKDSHSRYLHNAYRTACHYSFEILNNMISLSAKFVRGSPSFQLNQIVYACVTLFDFLGFMSPDEKKRSLSLITQSYWHLNQIGEKMNDATETISGIIRKLVDMANSNQVLEYEQKVGSIGQGSITEKFNKSLEKLKKRKEQRTVSMSQQQQKLSPDDLPFGNDNNNHETVSNISNGSSPETLSHQSITNQISLANDQPSSLKLIGGENYLSLLANGNPSSPANTTGTTGTTGGLLNKRTRLEPGAVTPTLSALRETMSPATPSLNHNNNTSTNAGMLGGLLPDTSNFETFEDFFKDMFKYANIEFPGNNMNNP